MSHTNAKDELSNLHLAVNRSSKILLFLSISFLFCLLLSLTNIAPSPLKYLNLFEYYYILDAAFFGIFIMSIIMKWPSRHELLLNLLIGVLIGAGILLFANKNTSSFVMLVKIGTGLGISSLLLLIIAAINSDGVDRIKVLSVLLPSMVLPYFILQSYFYLGLNAALHPQVLDNIVYVVDYAYGVQLSFLVGRLFNEHLFLKNACLFVYVSLPIAIAIVYSIEAKSRKHSSGDVLTSFIALGAIGYVLYNFYPVIGPFPAFPQWYPHSCPPIDSLPLAPVYGVPLPRNCMPSLHFAWALLLWLHSRPLSRWVQTFSFIWVFLTVLATLGLGFHYFIDLIVAVPFTVAVKALCSSRIPFSSAERKRAVWCGGLITVAWLLVLRFGFALFLLSPGVIWPLSLITLIVSFILEKRISQAKTIEKDSFAADNTDLEIKAEYLKKKTSKVTIIIAVVFILSGFAGLLYEVVFPKILALTFGSTATASTTVLATYMGGLSIGAWIGGHLGSRRKDALKVYALCEIGIGVWSLLSPFALLAVQRFYVSIASGADPSNPLFPLLQFVLGSIVLLPLTILMGITMPVLTRHFTDLKESLGRSVGLLYGANTFGAAFGALLTGYILLPAFGVRQTTLVAVAVNFLVALIGLRIAKKLMLSSPSKVTASHEEPEITSGYGLSYGVIGIIILTVGGMLTLSLEVIYIHLLAVVAGNSAYAFSLMLFTFLLGLCGGSSFSRFTIRQKVSAVFSLGLIEFLLAITLFAGVFIWNEIPEYFATFYRYPLSRDFGSREFIRGIVCFLAMVPPSFCIGAVYPLAMELVERSFPNKKIQVMGYAMALNTLGNILGALLGAFVLLPLLGSLKSLHLIAVIAFTLGLLPVIFLKTGRRTISSLSVASLCVLLFVLQPKSFNFDAFSSGANVYFVKNNYGKVIDYAESMDGGLTTVAQSFDKHDKRVLTLLTNGKFQGDNSPHREMKAQTGVVLSPLLHTKARNKALVIGYGVGVSARTVYDAGFRSIDIVDISEDIIQLADRYFSEVNKNVTQRQGVHTYVTDGRNFLLLQPEKYDLITMEISSIWFAGAASLYNREFYRLAGSRLADDGVLQQWIQLHHISVLDILSIISTVRSEFVYVWLYFAEGQGVIVASNKERMPSNETISFLEAGEGLKEILSLHGGDVQNLLKGRVLHPQSVDRMLAAVKEKGLSIDSLVSTDDNLFLEYNTPRGNIREYSDSLRENLQFLKQFSPPSFLEGTLLK